MASLPYSIEALVFGRSRSVSTKSGDTIVPDVVISEMHDDDVVVTTHPVDVGAQIADHAYRQPAIVTCVFGWSDSSRLLNSALDGSILKGVRTTRDVYEKLLEIKDRRMPLYLSTGKRKYPNVLITKMKTTTSVDTESAAIIEITFQEILIADAKTTTLQALKQRDAKRTASTRQAGHKQLIPVDGARFKG